MKRSLLAHKGKSETSKTKNRIQDLIRAIAILRDGGCVLAPYQGQDSIPYCNGYRKDGEFVLQFDHLNSRAFNVSYADVRLGVTLCKGHHGWKHFTERNTKQYNDLIKSEVIEQERVKLWELVEQDRKAYPMSAWEWAKVEIALKKDLEALQQ